VQGLCASPPKVGSAMRNPFRRDWIATVGLSMPKERIR